MITSINILYIFTAFIAGFLTFFVGCIAPIAPVYVAFLTGSTNSVKNNKKFLQNALFFTFGFISIFLLFGFGVNSFAGLFARYRYYFQKIIGVIVIFLGLFLLDLFHINWSSKTLINKSQKGTKLGALLLGMSMSFAWTPCIGPVLATILLWLGSSSSLFAASIYLIAFAIGLSLPFILIGIGFDYFYPKIQFINKHNNKIKRTSAIILIIIGILMLSGYYAYLNIFIQKISSSKYLL